MAIQFPTMRSEYLRDIQKMLPLPPVVELSRPLDMAAYQQLREPEAAPACVDWLLEHGTPKNDVLLLYAQHELSLKALRLWRTQMGCLPITVRHYPMELVDEQALRKAVCHQFPEVNFGIFLNLSQLTIMDMARSDPAQLCRYLATQLVDAGFHPRHDTKCDVDQRLRMVRYHQLWKLEDLVITEG